MHWDSKVPKCCEYQQTDFVGTSHYAISRKFQFYTRSSRARILTLLLIFDISFYNIYDSHHQLFYRATISCICHYYFYDKFQNATISINISIHKSVKIWQTIGWVSLRGSVPSWTFHLEARSHSHYSKKNYRLSEKPSI